MKGAIVMKRFLILAILCMAIPALAQDAKLNLTNLEKLSSKATNVTDVSLDKSMLKLAAQSMNKEDKEEHAAKDLISGLDGVYVKVFEFDKDNQYSPQDIEAVRSQLQGPGWSRSVNIREEKTHELTEIYLMKGKDGDGVVGLAILVAEPRELVVVNIVGPIDMAKIGALGALGNLGNLGSLGNLGTPQLKKREPAKGAAGTKKNQDE
ncbi:MAG: hypothetical protein DMG65_02910 [Candidatus Angelobacter sp. Gp1-AA117]|nr:MAG: hypothetical protein DMG65_02910 [Candidatus Angelobacter sp. Gp1-AA117]